MQDRRLTVKKLFFGGTAFLFLNKALFFGLLVAVLSFLSLPGATLKEENELVVLASWYGPGFHGEKMANGKKFDMRRNIAAHPTLPLGTKLKVTNLRNQRSVVVAVMDRGPYVAGRELDLSYGAARRLGGVKAGVIPVKIKILS